MRAMRPALVVDPIFLRLTTCLALRETPPSQLVAPTIERLFRDVVALAPILHRLVPVLGLPQVADDLLVGKSLLHRVLLATRIKENSLAKCYKKRLRSYALYARRAGSVCPMPDGLSVRVMSGTGAAPERVRTGMSGALRRNTRVPAEYSDRAYAGVVTGGIPRWRVASTRPVESGPASSGTQFHGGGYAQQVSRAAYERWQERTQCRRGGRGDIPRQRSAIDRRCHQDDFAPGRSKASPEVAPHQAPLAQVARRACQRQPELRRQAFAGDDAITVGIVASPVLQPDAVLGSRKVANPSRRERERVDAPVSRLRERHGHPRCSGG